MSAPEVNSRRAAAPPPCRPSPSFPACAHVSPQLHYLEVMSNLDFMYRYYKKEKGYDVPPKATRPTSADASGAYVHKGTAHVHTYICDQASTFLQPRQPS